jgi:hypothetical protein
MSACTPLLPFTLQDQIKFNRFLASTAHKYGLGVGLKNAIDLVGQLKDYYDW